MLSRRENLVRLAAVLAIIGGLLLIGIVNGLNSHCPFCGWAPAGTPWTKDRFDPNAVTRKPNP